MTDRKVKNMQDESSGTWAIMCPLSAACDTCVSRETQSRGRTKWERCKNGNSAPQKAPLPHGLSNGIAGRSAACFTIGS
ncbi:hypothetical protein BDW66DRAFT_131630 [Aspergillus desertorum]